MTGALLGRYAKVWPSLPGRERRRMMEPLRSPATFCVRSFEANPKFAAALAAQEAQLRGEGKDVRLIAAALSNRSDAAAPRTLTTYARNEWGSTVTTLPFADIFSGEKKVRRLASEAVAVPSYDVRDVLRHARRLNASSTLALKLDVEGDEEWIMQLLSDELELVCELEYLFVEFHHLPGSKPGSGRANLTRWGLPEEHYELVKAKIHTAMDERPGCKLKIYWRSFWAACGDVQRFEWEKTPQVTDEPGEGERGAAADGADRRGARGRSGRWRHIELW